MIYNINYEEMAAGVNPLAFKRYLKETGWTAFQTKREDIAIYQYMRDTVFEQVTIPLDRRLCDYAHAMYTAVKGVASIENRSSEQMLLILLNPYADIIKIRIADPDVEAGNILVDRAVNLYDNARKLVVASALDILHPKPFHAGRIDDIVQKFVDQCRFGQTEIGSYVISLVCPFGDCEGSEWRQLSIFSPKEECSNSLTRKVTSHLMRGVYAIKTAVDEETDLTEGISANFCDALANIGSQNGRSILEFGAQWSPSVSSNIPQYCKVSLTGDYVAPILELSKKLRPKRSKTTKILGRVKALDANPLIDQRRNGTVTISYLNESAKASTLKMVLESADYGKAILAHQTGQYISAEGTITGNTAKKMDCTAFSIIDDF